MGCGPSRLDDAAPPDVEDDSKVSSADEVPPSVAPISGAVPTSASALPPEEREEQPPSRGLKNRAGQDLPPGSERTCKFGCGRLCAVSKEGRVFDTCCRACATSANHDLHDEMCRGLPVEGKTVCAKGSRCRDRSADHLAREVHPLDDDYPLVCQRCDVDGEALTLKVVFDWLDEDGSGKLSREELTRGIKIVGDLRGDEEQDRPVINDRSWKQLDEDGNGVVNFSEFACWAGPRWGLPLGLKRNSSSVANQGRKCTVIGCPCYNFCKGEGKKAHKCTFCKHKESKHVPPPRDSEIDFPPYWNTREEDGKYELVPLQNEQLQDFQALLDSSYRGSWTRDRSRHNPDKPQVPKGYRVLRAFRNENRKNWGEYYARLAELETQAREAMEGTTNMGPFEIYHENVRTTMAAAKFQQGDVLQHDCNEWYLLHGTNPRAAQAICSSDFVISTAGSNTGTLYGRGLYFADSITKADEYSKPNSKGHYAVLLCRVLGGRVLYTDEVTPDPEELVNKCVVGEWDTVLGDREKCRGTFKEFVLFDTEDVYPEYVIEYERIY